MAHKMSEVGLIKFLDLRILDIVKESYHPPILLILILTIILSFNPHGTSIVCISINWIFGFKDLGYCKRILSSYHPTNPSSDNKYSLLNNVNNNGENTKPGN